jgi:segregation and condensation protein B
MVLAMDSMSESSSEMESNQIQISEENENNEIISLKEMLMAFLFVSIKPIPFSELVSLTKSNIDEVNEAIELLEEEILEFDIGLELKNIGESYQLRTKPKLAKTLQRMITPKMKRLSKASAETLAVVAYKQPVSRAEIEAIRGVDALPTIKTLLDGRLVRIVGREDTPGSPALYGTTDFFLERFGLRDLSELPTIREVRELADEDSEISNPLDNSSEDELNEVGAEEMDEGIDDSDFLNGIQGN